MPLYLEGSSVSSPFLQGGPRLASLHGARPLLQPLLHPRHPPPDILLAARVPPVLPGDGQPARGQKHRSTDAGAFGTFLSFCYFFFGWCFASRVVVGTHTVKAGSRPKQVPVDRNSCYR